MKTDDEKRKKELEKSQSSVIDNRDEIKRISDERDVLNSENSALKNRLNDIEKQMQDKDKSIEKYKEFLSRTQDQCKTLEMEKAKEVERKETEINELKAAKMEVEERYNRTIKSKKLSDDKERILLNTFDALKKY